MPDGSISTLFTGRFDQQLAFLQVGRMVNPSRFAAVYASYRDRYASLVVIPIGVDCANDRSSYFKFNLDYISFYLLIHFEQDRGTRSRFNAAYRVLRHTTVDHANAHFNMIDRALGRPDPVRDSETIALLNDWLLRPKRDVWVDLRSTVEVCGDEACSPIPVKDRVTTDFLWQRDPFQLVGGGAGTIEGAGIDYILPFWMARYFKLPV
jgi:hypothetical protein